MWPAEAVPGRDPNPFVYPNEKSLLDYDDFHAVSGSRQEKEEDDDGLLSRIFSQYRLETEGKSGEHEEATQDENRVTEMKRLEEKRGRMMRKRPTGKTDRHSKIHTVQGLRDRRIRLSVQVSRKFFDLQDMLGFDKASNTIEWLIAKSRGAIKGLSLRRVITSSKDVLEISKCDVSSMEQCGPVDGKAAGIQKGKSRGESSRLDTRRDLRERARVRARERTREKTMAKISKFSIHEEKPNDSPNFSASDVHRDLDSIEKFLGITRAFEPSFHPDPTGSYYSENTNYSGDDEFQDGCGYPGSGNVRHFGGYYP